MDKELCSTKEAAELLGVTPTTICNWMRKGLLSSKLEKGYPLPTRESIQLILEKNKGLVDLETEIEKYTLELKEVVAQLKQKIEDKDDEEVIFTILPGMRHNIQRIFTIFLASMYRQHKITERECDIMSMILSGDSIAHIADKYNLSKETISHTTAKAFAGLARDVEDFSSNESQFEEITKLKEEINSLKNANRLLEWKMRAFGPIIYDEDEIERRKRMIEFYKTELTDCNFSNKALKDIQASQFKTIGKVLTYSKNELLTFYNFSQSTLKEIEKYLSEHDYSFYSGKISCPNSGKTPCYKCEHSMNPATGLAPTSATPCLCKFFNVIIKSVNKRGCYIARGTALTRELERNLEFRIR